MKCAAMLLLICLVGCAAADGYTTSQGLFLRGTDPVEMSMDESPFEQYVETYWSSYIDNPANVPAGPIQTGPSFGVDNATKSLWMATFPFDVPASSFGKTVQTNYSVDINDTMYLWVISFPFDVPASSLGNENAPKVPESIFGIDKSWLYTTPFLTNSSSLITSRHVSTVSVQKNHQFLEQEIKGSFGL
ncbi:MAG: hypothetical protein ACXQT4_01990 [Methanotrichaceae archaeon]